MNPRKIVVDTDIILRHLLHTPVRAGGDRRSQFRKALTMFFCYTTVFNAIELFALCRSEKESQGVQDSLGALKILGLNSKTAKSLGALVRKVKGRQMGPFDVLIAGLCVESRLPLLTGRPQRFRSAKSLRVVPVRLVETCDSAEEILRRVS